MKKAAIGAALLGLLFVGCATTEPRDPGSGRDSEGILDLTERVFQDVMRDTAAPVRHDPPAFRDVLRQHVGRRVNTYEPRDRSTIRLSFSESGECTLAAVGEDYVRLAYDGHDRFLPLTALTLTVPAGN